MAWSYQTPLSLSDADFLCWQRLIEERTGIDLSQHRSILQAGLIRHLRECGDNDVEALLGRVSGADGSHEWQRLLAQITVKETSFLRQPAAFELVRRFLQARVATRPESLELWSVGCASGEETWGLAMVADRIAREAGIYYGVLGSDICVHALNMAREGIYTARRLEPLPAAWHERYFEPLPHGRWRVIDELRPRVGWVRNNLLQLRQLPPLPMDVIYCQNVLVYFRRWRVKQVADALVARLKPGGLLVLGPGEAAQWQHPAMVRVACDGVSAWRRRGAEAAAVQI